MAEKLIPDYTIHHSSYEHRIINDSQSWLLDELDESELDDIIFIGEKRINHLPVDKLYVLKSNHKSIKVKPYLKVGDTYRNRRDKKPRREVLRVRKIVKEIEKIHPIFNGFLVTRSDKALPFCLSDYCRTFGNSNASFFKVDDKIICLIKYDCESG